MDETPPESAPKAPTTLVEAMSAYNAASERLRYHTAAGRGIMGARSPIIGYEMAAAVAELARSGGDLVVKAMEEYVKIAADHRKAEEAARDAARDALSRSREDSKGMLRATYVIAFATAVYVVVAAIQLFRPAASVVVPVPAVSVAAPHVTVPPEAIRVFVQPAPTPPPPHRSRQVAPKPTP
jgi:hypothetical protein